MAFSPRGYLVRSPSCDSPPRYSLLTSIPPLTVADPHWASSGIEWEDFLCSSGVEAFIEECYPVTGFTKPAERNTQFCAADPFVVVGSYDCPPVGRTAGEAFEIARKRLLVWESHQVEETLWTGVVSSSGGATTVNPSFAFGNSECDIAPVDINAAGAVDPVAAISLLEGALGEVVSCGATIHVPYELVTYLARFNLLTVEDDVYYTHTGVKVVAGHGYPGSGPANIAAAAGELWIFGTGPVILVASNMFTVPESIGESVDRNVNNQTVRAEKFYAAGFSCALLAIRVDLCAGC